MYGSPTQSSATHSLTSLGAGMGLGGLPSPSPSKPIATKVVGRNIVEACHPSPKVKILYYNVQLYRREEGSVPR